MRSIRVGEGTEGPVLYTRDCICDRTEKGCCFAEKKIPVLQQMEQFTSLARKGRTFPPPLFVRCNLPSTARSAAGSKFPSFAGEALFLLD
jgi:hypothetical protein